MRDSYSPTLELRLQSIGSELLKQAEEEAEGPAQQWFNAFLSMLMEDEHFRIQALRFIDVLPMLKDDHELVRHMKEYFTHRGFPLPEGVEWTLRHADAPLLPHIAAPLVRRAVRYIAKRFIAGESSKEALHVLQRLAASGLAGSLDLLGEAVLSESEADAYQQQYLELIDALAKEVPAHTGFPLHLSLKVTSLYSQTRPVAFRSSVEGIKARLRPILHRAKASGVGICLDMEHYDTKAITLAVFRELLMEDELRDWEHCGIALQAYLRETEHDLLALLEWGKERGVPFTVRLVRGAYWDMETVVASRENWPCPVWRNKAQTDLNYERCLGILFGHHRQVCTAVASHNVRSIALALALAEKHGLSPDKFEFQMLYGMADALKRALVDRGQRVRVYVPLGPLIPGMAYLVRRLLENTTQSSFIRQAFAEKKPAHVVLSPPSITEQEVRPRSDEGFRNEPVHRFTCEEEREAFSRALDEVSRTLGTHYPLTVCGRHRRTGVVLRSTNPAHPSQLIGTCDAATGEEVDAAVEAAEKGASAWSKKPMEERVAILRRAAALLHKRRDWFAALEVLEAGKPWLEADADVCEAVDALMYYCHQAELLQDQAMNVPGENNLYRYRPRGICAVIPPWNFPLAIPMGMVSSALVTGNAVILKPSSQTPILALHMTKLLHEAGVTDDVLFCLPGSGDEVGERLVSHPAIATLAFTGSLAVGTRIMEQAACIRPGQVHVKRVIAEMGGKNAIIVDDDADLDDAVAGIVTSAFGYAGQKCSACSRVIAVGDIADSLWDRLVEATKSLSIGDPRNPDVWMGPVISAEARRRIVSTIEQGKAQATLLLQGQAPQEEGHYVAPAIFTDVPLDSRLALDEIFGPVLACFQAASFEEALHLAMQSRYALTGGVYTRSPSHMEAAIEKFDVGNLYLNRKITGAVVGRQPFGGFRLSGSGFKAGGPDYLKQFLDAQTVSENTLRRGFAPPPGRD